MANSCGVKLKWWGVWIVNISVHHGFCLVGLEGWVQFHCKGWVEVHILQGKVKQLLEVLLVGDVQEKFCKVSNCCCFCDTKGIQFDKDLFLCKPVHECFLLGVEFDFVQSEFAKKCASDDDVLLLCCRMCVHHDCEEFFEFFFICQEGIGCKNYL